MKLRQGQPAAASSIPALEAVELRLAGKLTRAGVSPSSDGSACSTEKYREDWSKGFERGADGVDGCGSKPPRRLRRVPTGLERKERELPRRLLGERHAVVSSWRGC